MNTQSSNKFSVRSALLVTRRIMAGIALLSLGVSQAALASDNSEKGGKWIIGVKASQVEIRGIETDTVRLEEADAYGFVLGYEFNKNIGRSGGTASFELEYLTTDETNIEGLTPAFGEYEADIINAYFTYRSPGKVFFKVKGGVTFSDISTNFDLFEPGAPGGIDLEDFSLAGGLGVGARFGERGIVELEYTSDSGDAEITTIALNGIITF